MMMSWVLGIQIFFLILGNSCDAWDGCSETMEHGNVRDHVGFSSWRCGDTCISWDAKCKCGDEIFKKEDQKWCCHNSCTP